jgi:histidinol phosphatase-like enzyme
VVIHTHTRERGEGRPKKIKEKPKNYLSHILSPLTKKKKTLTYFLYTNHHKIKKGKKRRRKKKMTEPLTK